MESGKYLTLQNLKTMIRAISPNEKSDIISKHLKNKIIIYKDDCYFINEDMVYEIEKNSENIILSMISELINESYKKLNDNEKQDLKELKNYTKIFENNCTRGFLPQ